MVLKTESKKAPNIAEPKELIENPGDIAATISSTNPFTTKINNPSVRIVIGIEIKIKIGLIIVLITPRISAAITIDNVPVNLKPGTSKLTTKKAAELINKPHRNLGFTIIHLSFLSVLCFLNAISKNMLWQIYETHLLRVEGA